MIEVYVRSQTIIPFLDTINELYRIKKTPICGACIPEDSSVIRWNGILYSEGTFVLMYNKMLDNNNAKRNDES